MNRVILLFCLLAACGDNNQVGLIYHNPSGGALRLVKAPNATSTNMLLNFVVGDNALTGYATGFDLPLDAKLVKLGAFTPGTALDPGSAPVAARGVIGIEGPLAGVLATGQSQKAAGAGAITTDSELAKGAVLYTIELDLVDGAPAGIVFDGTATDFVLPSGGLRDRAGLTVVEATDVKIGKLEVRR